MLFKRGAVFFFFIILYSYVVCGDFDIGLNLVSIDYNLSDAHQINLSILVNGNNAYIRIPMIYSGSILFNISLEKPVGWYNGSNWYIAEGAQTKNVIANGTHLQWLANTSCLNPFLFFQVPPPFLFNISMFESVPFYEKNFSITSENHLVNITGNISINGTYDSYSLFWLNGSWQNSTSDFSLTILGDFALFNGISTSTQHFQLQGFCTPDWICSDWSGCVGGIQTRTCTDNNNCSISDGMPTTARACEVVAASGGGGGGRTKIVSLDYDISPNIIRLALKENDLSIQHVTIKNIGSIKQKFRIFSENSYVSLGNSTLILEKGEVTTVEVVIHANRLKPDSYFGKILVSNGNTEKEILIILEVESRQKMLNLHLDVSAENTVVQPGGLIKGTVTIYNLFGKQQNVLLNYNLKDINGNLIIQQSEQVTVYEQLSFEKSFVLPQQIQDGNYILSVTGAADSYISVASALIRVSSPELTKPTEEKPAMQSAPSEHSYISALIIVLMFILLCILGYRAIQIANKKHKKQILPAEFKDIKKQIFWLLQREDKLHKEQNKLLQSQKSKENTLLSQQKILDLQKLEKKTELERIRLQKQRERNELVKNNQYMQEQELREKKSRMIFLARQRKKEELLLEKKRLHKIREAQKEELRIRRKKKMRDFFHTIGLYRTKTERELDYKKKEQEVLLAMELLDEKRKEWQARQSQIELEKLNKMNELELLKLKTGEEKKPEIRSPLPLLKLPNSPDKENLSIDLINQLLDYALKDLNVNHIDSAYNYYVKIRNIYQTLSPEARKNVLQRCIELHELLLRKFSS